MKLARVIYALLVVSAVGGGFAGAQTPNPQPSPSGSYDPNSDYYTNSSGHLVHRPEFSPTAPAGWTARCADGSFSFSEHRRGTCSHHGGVVRWH